MQVRVRFAPSPTGALHIGGVRTALYNFLFAKKNKGAFILRIEDTDQNRFVEGALEYILESLDWLGIKPDEGIRDGGPFGPYQQSLRKAIYIEHAMQLIKSGYAYYAFDTPDELDSMRERLKGKDVQLYNFLTRGEMRNSLVLGEAETKKLLQSDEQYVIRLKVPENKQIIFHDLIRGDVVFESVNIDDKVLIKSDGMPTYHLANVVDDHLMKISHVIRGEEWLSSTPVHVLLYESFGWKDEMPQFAHLPLLLKPDGKGKLSKRDADKQGFPIFPLSWTDPNSGEISEGFKERGFLPDALTNFLALLGWNPGTEKEIYSLDELIKDFTLDRIQKGGSRFDFEKALWFNQHYIRNLSTKEFFESLQTQLKERQISFTEEKIETAVNLMKERVTFLSELYTEAEFLWNSPEGYDEAVVKKRWNNEAKEAVEALIDSWKELDDFSPDELKRALEVSLNSKGISPGKIMQSLRLVVTGKGGGPDLMAIISFIGKDETIKRMQEALKILKPA